MCKRNEMIGSCLMAFGAGFLLSLLFSSDFALAVLGIGLVVGGLLCCKRT